MLSRYSSDFSDFAWTGELDIKNILNDDQKECEEIETSALKQKLVHMEAELKQRNAEKEYLVQRVASLEQDLAKKEAQLNLRNAEKEDLIQRVISLEHDRVKEEADFVKKEADFAKKEADFAKKEADFAKKEADFAKKEADLAKKEAQLNLARKMSTPKTKLPQSNLQLVSDKEVVISLERLIDSVVMEVTTHRSALQPQQVKESNDDALGINSLPDEIIIQIFGYLEQNQLGQISRVCRRWNVLTTDPVLWKKVNVKFSPFHRFQTTVAKSFINRLPSCVTSIRLDFTKTDNWIGTLDYAELCVKLKEKCPNIKVLILTASALSDSIPSVIDVCSELQDIKSLAFHHCIFPCNPPRIEVSGISKIEVLDLSDCDLGHFNKPHFSRMPCLKVLLLSDTYIDSSYFVDDASFLNQLQVLNLGFTGVNSRIFPSIQNHGHNLKELYLCSCFLPDHDLTFTDSAFPHLKKICLSCTYVTCEDVVSLIRSCPSLENVYVDEGVVESFVAHPFVVANRCKPGIVKVIEPIHYHTVDYSHN